MDLAPIWPYATFATLPAAAWAVVRASDRMELSWRRTAVRGVAKFVRFTSLLLMAITIPSGAIDISDLWLFSAFALVPSLLLLATVKARLIQRTWVRVMARGLSAVLFGLAAISFVLLCILQTACEARMKPIYSPDGRHMALIRVSMQGAVGRDSASVTLRRSWRPLGDNIWLGILIPSWPEVRWLDNSRLLIRYEHEPRHTVCDAGRTGEVEVVCEILPAQAR